MPAGPTLFFIPEEIHEAEHDDTEERVEVIEQHVIDDEEYGDPDTQHDMYCRHAHVTSLVDRGGSEDYRTILDFGGFTVKRDILGTHVQAPIDLSASHILSTPGDTLDEDDNYVDIADGSFLIAQGPTTAEVIATVPVSAHTLNVSTVPASIPTGTDMLNVGSGAFKVTQGNAGVEVVSAGPISAPNIHEYDHEDTSGTVVKRSIDHEDGMHLTNLVVQSSAPFAGDDDLFRPGLNFSEGTTWGDLSLLGFGRAHFYPYTMSGNSWQQVPDTVFRFGASEDEQNTTNEFLTGHGIYMKGDNQNGDGNTHTVEIGVSANLPSIRVTGTKISNVPFIEYRDSSGEVKAAVLSDGSFSNHWHNVENLDLLNDVVSHSVVTGNHSVYIGTVRISWNDTSGLEEFHRLNRIPLALQSAPYSVVLADLGGVAADRFTVQQYLLQRAEHRTITSALRTYSQAKLTGCLLA